MNFESLQHSQFLLPDIVIKQVTLQEVSKM